MSRLRPSIPWFRLVPLPSSGVQGAASSTDNAIARWDGTTGTIIQNSGVTIDDSNNVTIPLTSALTVGTIELGHATDTTLSRVSAGVIAVEGNSVATAANNLSFFAATTSLQLLGNISDETGSGALVFGTSPAFTTSITTPSTTFALFNDTATTINFAGAATTLNIGASATCILNFGGSTTASEFRFLEPSGSGTNYTAFKAAAQAANITYTLPTAVGAVGTYLKDAAGDGVLSWATAGGGDLVVWKSATEGLLDDDGNLAYTGNAGIALSAIYGGYPIVSFTDNDAGVNYWRVSVKVPATATSISSIEIIYANDTVSGDLMLGYITDLIDYAGLPVANSQDSTQSAPAAQTSSATAGAAWASLTVPSTAYNGLVISGSNDIVSIRIQRDSDHASDTYNAAWRVAGVLFTFAA